MKKITRESLVQLTNIVGRLTQLIEDSKQQTINGVHGLTLTKEGLEYFRNELQSVIEREL